MTAELRVNGTVHNIDPPLDTHVFNGGLVNAWGRLITVYRVNRRPTLLALSELDDDFVPRQTKILWDAWDPTLMPEDPRVIVRDNQLYVMWAGICGKHFEESRICHGLWDSDYRMISKSVCWFQWMDTCEKNWSPFTNVKDGELYCIYNYDPLTVLHYQGGAWRLEFARRLKWPWKYGHMSGGAPPVWHKGRWYCFFHSSRIEGNVKIYYAGCCAFDADFNVLGITQEPILAGAQHVRVRKEDLPWTPGSDVSAVFPCGAIVRGDDWLISYGFLDAELRIAVISQAEIDKVIGLTNPGEAARE